NDDQKKKLTLPCSPSRVLHLREIPRDVTEAEVLALGLPFGKVTNLLMLKGKSQALMEMISEETATNMMNYYSTVTPQLHDQPVCLEYSYYHELKTDYTLNQESIRIGWEVMNAVQSGNTDFARVLAHRNGLLQGNVLRVTVENVLCPVTADVLHQVFSQYGYVLKIIIFMKDSVLQALIQYDDPMNAFCAKMALDCQNIYSGCCTLRIDFSKLSNLKIKYNNDRCRDFTGCAPPVENQLPPAQPTYAVPVAVALPTSPVPLSTVPIIPKSSVLLVSNLNPEKCSGHISFLYFAGAYGDVHRVKILYNRRESALIQMASVMQAQIALLYLNGQMLYGRSIQAVFSKHQTVRLPQQRQDDEGLTKDYTNSPLHRFKWPGSKNYYNIFPPSATLHLTNIPQSVTGDDLKQLFTKIGCTVKGFRFLENSNRMALIKLGCVEEALHALIELHGYDLGKNCHLRVSFSKQRI
ncbi:PTBP3 protein, partial [Turnix velox]|nr:PTBP3 protein [Turnix velox]